MGSLKNRDKNMYVFLGKKSIGMFFYKASGCFLQGNALKPVVLFIFKQQNSRLVKNKGLAWLGRKSG